MEISNFVRQLVGLEFLILKNSCPKIIFHFNSVCFYQRAFQMCVPATRIFISRNFGVWEQMVYVVNQQRYTNFGTICQVMELTLFMNERMGK